VSLFNPVHIVVPSTLDVVTLPQAKQHLKIDGDDSNDIIALYIKAAVKKCEDYRQAAIMSAQHELYSTCFGNTMSLQKFPVSAINSVKYYDENDDQQTVDASDYRLQSFMQPCVLEFTSSFDSPDLSDRQYPVVINFNAGYTSASSVPATIKLGVLNTLGTFNEIRQISLVGNGLTKVDFWEIATGLLDSETMWI
jgi:uncharacterized phiE125 gp8 family phage protein